MLRNCKGFNLTELMIVVAIIGLLSIISAPSMITMLPRYSIKAAARDFTSQLRKARGIAIKEKRDVSVFIDTNNNNFLVDNKRVPPSGTISGYYGSGVRLGKGEASAGLNDSSIPADFVDFDDNLITFNSRGVVTQGLAGAQGAIYFTNKLNQAYAVTLGASGKVALLKWRNDSWAQ